MKNAGSQLKNGPGKRDYRTIAQTISAYGLAVAKLKRLDGRVDERFTRVVSRYLPKFTELRALLINLDAAAELIVKEHPEWWSDSKSIKTPAGSLQVSHSSALEMDEEQVGCRILRHQELLDDVEHATARGEPQETIDAIHETARREGLPALSRVVLNPEVLLRKKVEVNREALEQLTEEELAAFGVRRVRRQHVKIKPTGGELEKAAAKRSIPQQEGTEKTEVLADGQS